MSILEPDSGNIPLVPPEEDLPELGQIPIGGLEPEVDVPPPLLEEPIESRLAETPPFGEAPGAIATDNHTDTLTGIKEGDPNIPLLEEEGPIEIDTRKKKKKDPGDSVKNALNLGKVGDKPLKYNDDIGIKSGKKTDKNDYYKFNLTGRENEVDIVVDGLKDNANVELLNKNGKSVLFKSTEKGKKAETINAELDKGTYYLRVYPQGNAKTKYGLSISAEEILKDPDSKPSGATNLGPLGKKKKVVSGEIGFRENGTRDNSDFYQFTLTEKFNNLNVVLDGLKDDANIELLAKDGKTIIDQSRTKGKKKEIIDQVLDAGTYYLKVEPKGNAKTKYRLSFDSDKIDDPDGNRNQAQEIKVGKKPKKVKDEIGFQVGGKRDQKDYYEFSLKKDSEVNISLDGLNQNVDLKLLGNKGNLLYSSTNKGKEVEQISTILEKGKYYALVQPVGGDRSEYILSLDADSNIKDPDAQLPGQELGKLKAKPINKTDQIGFKEKGFVDTSDFWKFQLTKETDLTINLDRLSQNADLELYDKDGTTLIYSSKKKGTAKDQISTILDKGTYYIKVKPNSGSKTDYRLSVSGSTKIAEKDDALPGTNLKELGNKKITKRNQIGFETSPNVRDLADFYNFSLAEQRGVNITLDGLSGDAKLSLLGTDGRQIEASNNKGNKDETINRSLPAGNYYIGVETSGGDVKTKYNLGITSSLQKDDFNNRKNAKQLGTLNLQDRVKQKNRVGFTEGIARDQADFYSFKLNEASDVTLSLDGLDENANLLLLDDKDTLGQSNAKGLKAERIEKELKPGTYYAAVFPASATAKTDYELTLGVTQKTLDLSSLKFEAQNVKDGLKAGGKVKVNYRVNNIGNTKADTFEVGFYLSKDEGIDAGDVLLDTVEIKSLSGGQNTKQLAKQLTLPGAGDNFWRGSGDYYLGMMVDNRGAIAEDNELNNTSSQRVGVDVSSDLLVSGFDVEQKTVNPGQKFDAKVTLENNGGKLKDFRVGFYVSSDNEITTSDTFIGSKTIASLGGKKTTTINKQLTLPVGSVDGIQKYFIGAIADDQNVLSEVNETNNIVKEKVSLSPVPKDNAGNELKKGRKVGALGAEVQKFSDWVGDFYGVSTDTHDYYKIELDDRSRLNLNLKGLSANANLYLYDRDGNLIKQSEESGKKKEAISMKLLPGTYHALVWENDGGNTNYDLEMSALPLEYPVPQITGWNVDTALNLGAVSATPITKTEYVGNPHGFEDDLNDFYKFQVGGGGSQVKIDLTALNANADLRLRDSKGEWITASETLQKADESITRNLTPGTYFAEVQSINEAETTYNLQIVGTPLPNNGAGDNPDKALDLESPLVEATVKDWVGDIDGIDYYKFAVGENSTVNLNLTGMSGNANLELFNEKQEPLASSSQDGNADDRIAINLAPGNYFAEVAGSSANTKYNLQLTATPRVTDLAGNDFNTVLDIGALTAFNQTEWVGNFDENDFYKFTIAEDSAVNLGLTGMNGNANITLYNSEQDWITSSSNSGNADEAIATNLEPGDYFVLVDASGLGADYNFTATATAIADLGGNTRETAGDMGDIAATQTFANWVGDVDNSDWYKFTIAGDSTVNLNLTGMTGNGDLYLYDETDDYSFASSTNSDAANEALAVNLNPGTYFAQVYSSSGNTNYSLSATATAIADLGGDTRETAGDMEDITTAPKTFSNWVGDVDGSDWFKFTLAQPSTVNLGLAGMSANGELYLYNETDDYSFASSENDDNANEAIAINLDPGTYFARVYRSSGNTNYNLTASATAIPDGAGNDFDVARDIGAVSAAQTFSDWVGGLDRHDYYKFNIAQNSAATLNLTGLTANANLYLYDINQNEILRSDADDTANESIAANLESGTYYALVWQSSGDTNYNLDLSATPLTYSPANTVGNTEAQTKNIGALGAAQTFTDFVGNQYLDRDKNDFYQFTLGETSTVNLNLGGMTADADLALLNSEYGSITESSQLTNIDEGITRNLVAGTYIAQVKSIENANTGYNLQLSATAHPDAAGEAVETARQVGTLAAPQTFNDWIGNVDDNDYYQFAIDAVSTVNINLGGMTGDGNISLYDIEPNLLLSSQNTENANDVIVADLNPGTYFVQVWNASGNFGTNYSLQLSPTVRVDNAGGADAPLDLGALTTANATNWVSPGIDSEDYYKFTVGQNSAVNLNLSGLTDAINFKLYNSTMEEIASGPNDENAETAIARNLTPGTYFVEVSNFSGNGTEYNFAATATPIAELGGDTRETAADMGDITAAKTVSNWVGDIDDSDWFKFAIAQMSTVNVGLAGMTANADIILYDSEGNSITSSRNSDNANEALAANLNPGTYYIDVNSSSGNTNYNLTASATAIPDAAGNDFDVARDIGAVSATQTFADWVGGLDRNDYYKFNLAQNSAVALNLTGLAANANLYLYDSNQEEIVRSTNDDTANESIAVNLASGTYYALAWQSSGDTNYSLDLSATPLTYSPANLVGNTEPQTKNIGALGAVQTLTDFVGNPHDIASDKSDFYQFTLAQDSTVNLSLSGLTANANLTLRNSESSRITDSTNFSNLDEAITRNLVAGTYIVQVNSVDDANTSYSLQLSAVARPDGAGGSFDTARQVGPLAGTQTFSDWVGNIDGKDYYQFTLGAKATVDVAISGLTDETSLYLYNSEGDTFTYDANGNYQGSSYVWKITGETASISRVLNPGTYFVGVFDYSSSSGLGTSYSLNLSAS